MVCRRKIMRILVVEDDTKIASFVVNGLKQSGFAVDRCADGEEAHVLASTTSYDAAILDIMLPKLDGLSLLRQLRKQGIRVPVIILSAKASVDDRIKGLQAGGDDYLTKPFAFFRNCLRACRRSFAVPLDKATEPTKLTLGDLLAARSVDAREVRRGSEKIDLQAREFSLLEYLLRHAGRVVTKTMILEHIWDYSLIDPRANVVDVLSSAACGARSIATKNSFTLSGASAMSSNLISSLRRNLSFRLNLWYAAVFMFSALALYVLLYFLVYRAVTQKDREVVETQMKEYALIYRKGGVALLRDWIYANQQSQKNKFFVRISKPQNKGSPTFAVVPEDWIGFDPTGIQIGDIRDQPAYVRLPKDAERDFTLEGGTLYDGSELLVGRSTNNRETVLQPFRPHRPRRDDGHCVCFGFIGGGISAHRAMKPVREIVATKRAPLLTRANSTRVCRSAIPTTNSTTSRNCSTSCSTKTRRSSSACGSRWITSPTTCALPSPVCAGPLKSRSVPIRIPDGATEALADCVEESDRVLTILQTLMDVSEAEAGAMKLARAPTDIYALWTQVIELYQYVAEEKKNLSS